MPDCVETIEEMSWIDSSQRALDPTQDTGLMALVAGAACLDIPCEARQILHISASATKKFEELDILRAAKRLGIKAGKIVLQANRLASLPTPAILRDCSGDGFCLFKGFKDNDSAKVLDPKTGSDLELPSAAFLERFAGHAILLSRQPRLESAHQPFSVKWFFPVILKHAAKFRLVIGASIIIQLFALISPLLFQQVIDKVLVSRGLQSLDILALGLLVIAFYEPLFTYLRSLIFIHMASSLNSELSARLFRHMVQLPLSYFRARQAGDIIARVRELDFIRSF